MGKARSRMVRERELQNMDDASRRIRPNGLGDGADLASGKSRVDVMGAESSTRTPSHIVELMVRTDCGSCVRVREQITPIIERANAQLFVRNVDEDPELAMEFGDRVPVVVLDDEEFACWEVDNDELEKALTQ